MAHPKVLLMVHPKVLLQDVFPVVMCLPRVDQLVSLHPVEVDRAAPESLASDGSTTAGKPERTRPTVTGKQKNRGNVGNRLAGKKPEGKVRSVSDRGRL